VHNIQELKVWNESVDLAVNIYQTLKEFPVSEKYGLSDQIKRASVSIGSNIAEGAGRNTPKEFIHFLGIASGSASELFTQLEIALRIKILTSETSEKLQNQLTYIQKMIYKLHASIRMSIEDNKTN